MGRYSTCATILIVWSLMACRAERQPLKNVVGVRGSGSSNSTGKTITPSRGAGSGAHRDQFEALASLDRM